jgi:hypothetical protein
MASLDLAGASEEIRRSLEINRQIKKTQITHYQLRKDITPQTRLVVEKQKVVVLQACYAELNVD